jgi:hypothetical protein
VTVTVNTSSTAPTNVSASPSTICAGQSTTLSASGGTAGTGSQLVWYSGSCGGTWVGTGSPITVSPNSTTTYYVRREAEGCAPTTCASATVTVNNVPGPGTISGPTTLCRGQSYTFSTTDNATHYDWYTTGAWEITFTGNGQPIVAANVRPGTTNSTNICVTPSNSCGNGSNRCLSVNIVDPPSVGPISGPTEVCQGKTQVVYSVPNQPGVTYNWSYSNNNSITIVSGQGTNSITVNFSQIAGSGVLTVTASNGSCSASRSINISVRVARWRAMIQGCVGFLTDCGGLPSYQPPPSAPCTGDNEGEVGWNYHTCERDPNNPSFFRECVGVWRCSCDP